MAHSALKIFAIMALGASSFVMSTHHAQAQFAPKDAESTEAPAASGAQTSTNAQQKSAPKLYVKPAPTNNAARNTSRTTNRQSAASAPNRTVKQIGSNAAAVDPARNPAIENLQRHNIQTAKANADKNDVLVKEMQAKWEAEREANAQADIARAAQEKLAEQKKLAQSSAAADTKNAPKDAVYKKDTPTDGLKKPARIFNVFD